MKREDKTTGVRMLCSYLFFPVISPGEEDAGPAV